MNSDNSFPFPNPMDYSFPALSPPNSGDSYPALTNTEEHHPQPFSNSEPPMFNLGVGNGMSNVDQSGGSNVGQLSGPRPRGRPRGSKNKPKENVLQMASVMKSVVLEIPPGSEVVEWLKQFAQSRNVFMNVLGGSGIVSQAAISQLPLDPQTIFSEKLCLISFSGTAGQISPSDPPGSGSFTASFGRVNGAVIGGMLWRLVSLGPMAVTAVISESLEVVGAGQTSA